MALGSRDKTVCFEARVLSLGALYGRRDLNDGLGINGLEEGRGSSGMEQEQSG